MNEKFHEIEKNKKISDNFKEYKKIIFLLGTVVFILIIAFKFIPQSFINFGNGEFKIKNCTLCTDSKCSKQEIIYDSFKVFDSHIQLYGIYGDGRPEIKNLPISDEMECSIAKNKNFMFSCLIITTIENNKTSDYENTLYAFDGAKKFIWNYYHRHEPKDTSYARDEKDVRVSCDVF
jgi:hypothetical protein